MFIKINQGTGTIALPLALCSASTCKKGCNGNVPGTNSKVQNSPAS